LHPSRSGNTIRDTACHILLVENDLYRPRNFVHNLVDKIFLNIILSTVRLTKFFWNIILSTVLLITI